ncbi:MAG: hypothetical protein AAGE76_09540 [Pseudomonadota bacterium]
MSPNTKTIDLQAALDRAHLERSRAFHAGIAAIIHWVTARLHARNPAPQRA